MVKLHVMFFFFCKRKGLCIAFRGNLVHILFIFSKQLGIFSLNFETLIKVSAEISCYSNTLNWDICACANHGYSFLFTICKFPDMIWSRNSHCGYALINKVGHWFHHFRHKKNKKCISIGNLRAVILQNLLLSNFDFIGSVEVEISSKELCLKK